MTKKKTEESAPPERDPWFNPYRYAASERAKMVLGQLIYDFERGESRKRSRTKKEKQWLWDVGYALLSDLAYHFLNGSPGSGLIVTRAKRVLGKKSRYHPPFFTQRFPHLLDEFKRFGYLEQRKGKYSGMPGQSKRTTIRAGDTLITAIKKSGIGSGDLALSEDEEVIILKSAKTGFWDDAERIEYKDTPLTNRLRDEVRSINSWLAAADISFDQGVYERPVDVRARRLYRYFANADFKSGGRLFRGFWETLSKPARLSGIRIEGEAVTEVDYAQLNPTLAYAEVGCEPPVGDAYILPGLEDHRDGVKTVFNALLFDKGPRRSFPKGVKVDFPPKAKIADVIDRIRTKHPMITSVLSTGAGFRLMFLESEILMRVLEQLQYKSIVGLPIFDAVIVKASATEKAAAVMKDQFKKATNIEIQVRLERSTVDDELLRAAAELKKKQK